MEEGASREGAATSQAVVVAVVAAAVGEAAVAEVSCRWQCPAALLRATGSRMRDDSVTREVHVASSSSSSLAAAIPQRVMLLLGVTAPSDVQ